MFWGKPQTSDGLSQQGHPKGTRRVERGPVHQSTWKVPFRVACGCRAAEYPSYERETCSRLSRSISTLVGLGRSENGQTSFHHQSFWLRESCGWLARRCRLRDLRQSGRADGSSPRHSLRFLQMVYARRVQ